MQSRAGHSLWVNDIDWDSDEDENLSTSEGFFIDEILRDGEYFADEVDRGELEKRLIEIAESNGIKIDLIDCDHDLGDFASDGGDGIKLLDRLAERKTYYPIAIHTMNPVGRENMQRLINRYWKNLIDDCGGE